MTKRGTDGFLADVLIVLFAIALVGLIFYTALYGKGSKNHVGTEVVDDVSRSFDTDETMYGLPFVENYDYLVECRQGRYSFYYNTTFRQSEWVAYLLTAEDVKTKATERSNHFVTDPKVVENGWPYAKADDYTSTGYDRGHLCPSADRDDDESENRATFYMSNIAPQTPMLNRGVWRYLEEQVRRWAVRYDSVYVVAGGILTDDMQTVNGIGVPKNYYKVLLLKSCGQWQTAGFIMPNSVDVGGEWSDYVVTVDSVEQVSGHDFYVGLPDDVEIGVEKLVGRVFVK